MTLLSSSGLTPLCSPVNTHWLIGFLVFGNFSLFKTPFLGRNSVPPSFVSFFVFYIFSYLLSKTMGCFSGCLMSSASIQKLFCRIYSAFKCSFDEFMGKKVVSPSYSSTILGLPPIPSFFLELFLHWSPVAYWAPTNLGSSPFIILSFCLFILFTGF